MYFERVKGPPFLFVPSLLPTYVLQRYVGYTYVLNSDEGLTERTLDYYMSMVAILVAELYCSWADPTLEPKEHI
jgi:hypothetical protein